MCVCVCVGVGVWSLLLLNGSLSLMGLCRRPIKEKKRHTNPITYPLLRDGAWDVPPPVGGGSWAEVADKRETERAFINNFA